MSFTSILQRSCSVALGSMQMMFSREVHVFNRAILKCKVRCHFPKPREVKRINVHGWDTRMSTNEGRRTLMRRALKGKHCLAH